MKNLPNQLIVVRLTLCGVLVGALELNWAYGGVAALAVFIVASFTDWLDGFLARRWKVESDFGKLFDPLADKILITVVYIGLVYHRLVPPWMVACILGREFLITGLRGVAASKGTVLAADKWGKSKTVSQMAAAFVGLLVLALRGLNCDTGLPAMLERLLLTPLIWIALIITVYSGLAYYIKNRKLLFKKIPS